jgi:hypothetical protein
MYFGGLQDLEQNLVSRCKCVGWIVSLLGRIITCKWMCNNNVLLGKSLIPKNQNHADKVAFVQFLVYVSSVIEIELYLSNKIFLRSWPKSNSAIKVHLFLSI